VFRQLQFRMGRENFCSIHVSMVPQPSATGEHKTKPTQVSGKLCIIGTKPCKKVFCLFF
jgi:CTP synthase (UTP-ammonia lyase)